MKTLNIKQKQGFTIIELMIVLVIVAILLALAYPSYIQYVRKANRGDAQQLLLNWSVNQEIWRSNNTQYAGSANIPVPTHDKFQFSLLNDPPGATVYTLQATALGDQANDKGKDGSYCGGNGQLLTLNQNGVKSPASCWD